MNSATLSAFTSVLLMALAGCVSQSSDRSTPAQPPAAIDWTPPVRSVDAKSLSPKEAKALLATLGFLYERARQSHNLEPQLLESQVKQQSDGTYEVRITFVGYWDDHVPGPMMGGFSVFYLDKDWKIVSSSGGA
jgi:hypothetical protein